MSRTRKIYTRMCPKPKGACSKIVRRQPVFDPSRNRGQESSYLKYISKSPGAGDE